MSYISQLGMIKAVHENAPPEMELSQNKQLNIPNTKNIGVDSFFDSFLNMGTLRPSRYEVEFVIPNSVRNSPHWHMNAGLLSQRLTLNCESITMPGRGLSTQPNRIYGPVREMPTENLYSGDLDVTFRMGEDMSERRFFEIWLDSIVRPGSNNFTYFNDYKSTVTISQLNLQNDMVYKMELFDVYPKTINPIDYNAGTTDEYVRQSLSLHFRKYEVVQLVQHHQQPNQESSPPPTSTWSTTVPRQNTTGLPPVRYVP